VNPKALDRVRRALGERVAQRTTQLKDITVEMHATAPRGGVNLNAFGQPRSAPDEPPAVEFGDLLNTIDNSVKVEGLVGSVVVNRPWLEYGFDVDGRRLRPRPMGRLAIAELKREVESGS